MKVICSKEVGGVSEESNVMNSDKYAKEFQNVFNSISVMELDPRLLRDSRQTVIDFVNQLDLYRKRSRQWAFEHSCHHNEMGGHERRMCQTT